MKKKWLFLLNIGLLLAFSACDDDAVLPSDENNVPVTDETSAIFLLIDEESIDNGNEPNDFSETDVNDQIAEVGLRKPLQFFEANIGQTIELYTGQVGDEGWFALKTIPNSWKSAGPTNNGTQN